MSNPTEAAVMLPSVVSPSSSKLSPALGGTRRPPPVKGSNSCVGVAVRLDTGTNEVELDARLPAVVITSATGTTTAEVDCNGGTPAIADVVGGEFFLLVRRLPTFAEVEVVDATGSLDLVRPAGFSPAGCEGSRELQRIHCTANQLVELSRRNDRREVSRFTALDVTMQNFFCR